MTITVTFRFQKIPSGYLATSNLTGDLQGFGNNEDESKENLLSVFRDRDEITTPIPNVLVNKYSFIEANYNDRSSENMESTG